jgi:hypothetical protein
MSKPKHDAAERPKGRLVQGVPAAAIAGRQGRDEDLFGRIPDSTAIRGARGPCSCRGRRSPSPQTVSDQPSSCSTSHRLGQSANAYMPPSVSSAR